MTRVVLLCSASLIALTPGYAFAEARLATALSPAIHPHRLPLAVLYNQNSNFGEPVTSQNFSTSFAVYDSAAADDFVIPAGHKWHVTEVDVTGMYFNGSGPATSEILTFYTNKNNRPATVKATFTLSCVDSNGNFACKLPGRGQSLSGGRNGKRYWLSVVANNCDFANGCGQWGWVQNTTTHIKPGQWENPNNGFGTGCTSWTDTSKCFGGPPIADDYAFNLKGTSR